MTNQKTQMFNIKAEINPFEHSVQLTRRQKLQVAIMTVTIAPIRVIMFIITLLITWLFARVCTAGISFPLVEPAGKTRSFLFNLGAKLFRTLLFCFGFHRIKVEGKRAKCKEAPILVVGPHSSMMDMFVFSVSSPLPSGLSAEANKYLPLLGVIGNMTQPIYVKRSDGESRKKAINELETRTSRSGYWPQTVLFPEAGCANRKAFITFKTGAFIPGVPVQPVLIDYMNDLDCFSWTLGSPHPLKMLWFCLCQFSIKAKINYLPVYYPNEKEKLDPKLYADNVRKIMSQQANLPLTDYSYEDCRLAIKAEKLNLPWRTGVIQYTNISKALGLNFDDIVKKLVEFSKINPYRKDGKVSLKDLADYYKVHLTSTVKELFRSEKFGNFINFRQYLFVVSSLTIQENVLKAENDIIKKLIFEGS